MALNIVNIMSKYISLPEDCQLAKTGRPDQAAPEEKREWRIAPNVPQTISLTRGEAFALTVTEDASDGVPTRGRMIFHRSAPPPADRLATPLKIPNGKSFDLSYPASALITAIEFDLSQGGLQVKKVPVGKK